MPSRWALVLLLLALVYIALALRYYYRASSDPVTIIQCDVDSFHQGLLQERQPIVCKGVGQIPAVQRFFAAQAEAADEARDDTWVADAARDGTVAAMYDRLNAGKWYHLREDPEIARMSSAAARKPPRQSWYDVLMTIQHRGTRRVRLYAPSETPRLWRECSGARSDGRLFCDSEGGAASTARYTEIVLSEGDAVLLPMRWWLETSSVAAASEKSENSGKSWSSELAWRNPLNALHHVARSFI